MQYTPEQIQKFQGLYQKHFGNQLSDKEALEQLQALLVVTELGLKRAPP